MTNPFLNLLSHRPLPELAAALRSIKPRLIAQWADVVRHALPTADELTFTQLRDDLPVVLDHMARAIESERPAPTAALSDITPTHGAVRFHQSYKLDELIIEYNVLRGLATQLLSAHLGRPLSTDEVVGLNAAIDLTVRRSTVAFVEHQTEQLKKATEAQSKYLSFLSHDLRGELNGVFLMIEVLRRELANEQRFAESLEDLDLMRRSIHQTIATMDRFLHAERFRKGKVQVRPADVNLASVLNEVGAQFAYQAKDKGLELKVEACEPCRATTDRELVMMILQNLASNALKYTPKGRVQIAAAPGPGERDGWRVTVSDQGPGIAPEKLSELFDSFTRGDTHGQPGVGLGLSIANQAAELLGARLWAESAPGSGAVFHLQLPKSPPARAEAAQKS
jgi:signal transduction histidine kinase